MATGERDRSEAVRRFSVRVFVGIGLVCYGLVLLLGEQFYAVFAPGDPGLVSFARAKSPLYFFGYFLAGFNILMVSFWQASHITRRALALSLLRSAALPPLLLAVLPALLGAESIWACQSLGEMLAALCALGMLRRRNFMKI